MKLRQKFNYHLLCGFGVLMLCGLSLLIYRTLEFAPASLPPTGNSALEEQEDEQSGKSRREAGLLFRRLQLQDENGFIDPEGLRKATVHTKKMKVWRKGETQEEVQGIQEAAVAPDSWSWLGPGNIGGRIRSIVIQPNNANNMWVGSVSGGIWRTTNGGTSWFPVNDFMANLAISSIIINPANSAIMYAGTGEGFGNVDSIQGAGIFRSNDSGVTWNQMASTNNPNFNSVNRLAISTDGATILAATNTGIWRSTDGGAIWSQRVAGQFLDIDFQPGSSLQAIAGGLGQALFSTNGGQIWMAAAFNPVIANGGTPATNGRVELAYAPSLTSTVYAGVNRNNGDVYQSTDGGQNYTRRNTGTNYMLGGNNQGWYDNAVWVNPLNSNFIIVGGIHLWRSTDGGTTLTQISDGLGLSAHADHHFMIQHPGFDNNTNKIVFSGNDGGIFRAADISAAVLPNTNTISWVELNNNLGITQFYGAAGSVSGIIIGGTQDNGTLRFSGSTENWTQPFGSDGGFCAADQTDSNFFYGETQNLGVIRSTDAGQTAAFITAGLGDANQNPPQANFIAPLILDPNNPDTLLAGGWSLWRSSNLRAATPAWVSIKNPTATNSPISAIAVSPGTSSFIVVGHNDGSFFLTTNGTAATPTWTQRGVGLLPARFLTRLVIDNSRAPNWIYATFGGFSGDNVYRSTDLGVTWTDITGNGETGLPDVPVRTLVYHPHNRNLLYVGTEVGIFTSENAGVTWNLPNGGPANVSVDELFWMGGDLIAATHGRGLYRASGGIYVDCNYEGAELGTFDKPYKTVTAAINAVTTYRPIWLKPCNYNEQLNTNKRLEIRSLGGAATIGTP